VALSPVPAAVLLAALGTAALLADHIVSIAAIAAALLVVCLRAPRRTRRLYLFGALSGGLGILVLSPFLQVTGTYVLWSGPTVPVIGTLDVTTEEIEIAARNGLRLIALALSFAAYAQFVDHDGLLASVGFARRSAVAAALATRLVPTLERDAGGLAEAVKGRGVSVDGLRGRGRLLSPLVAGSLERASGLAEAMEARGFGREGRTRAPRPAWTRIDRAVLPLAVVLVVAGLVWL
jgi:energy-coupling factor transport system permease protein